MIKSTVVDRKTLAWIKDGVDETLKSVLGSLDEYIENTDDVSPIEQCISPLHRVKGAVEMVGIEGATMLASEMEQLATALAGKQVKHKNEAAEVLAAGILQLPGYLESLYHGNPDLPLVLLPMLNDFRASQDNELFTEGDFFSPNLSVKVPVQAISRSTVAGSVATVAKKLRPGYLSGLLGVFKEQDLEKSLEKLILVLDNLLLASTTEKEEQLWWVALGVVESLKEQGLESSVAVKMLLGRVDRQIKQIIKSEGEAHADSSRDKIIKSLLYYVAQSQSYSDRVIEIKKAFSLGYADEDALKNARGNLYGFNANLVDSISAQLTEELTSIKCTLDIILHGRAGDAEGMEEVLENFSSVGDALDMLGMGRHKDLINEQKEFLSLKIFQGEPISESDLMDIATVLLTIEASLGNLGREMQQTTDEDDISAAEYDDLLKVVAQEILEEIKVIKNEVNEFSKEPSNILLVGNVPKLLKQIAGAARTINDEQQSNLTSAIGNYFNQEIIVNQAGCDKDSLDLLADAITGLENYYQSVIEESVAPELGLQVAEKSMVQLGYPPAQMVPVLTTYATASNM
jgi:chemosensory pili system protein ChpA (sensor histidine kinase/response regulator)